MVGSDVATPFDVYNLREEVRDRFASHSWTSLSRSFQAAQSLYPEPDQPSRKRIGLIVILLHPHNAGEIRLQSADPFVYPLIDPKYFQNDIDVDILAEGLKTALQLFRSPEVKKYDLQIAARHAPGCEKLELWSDEYLKCHVRSLPLTVYHPVSTCRMGREGENSVVDTKLR